LGGVFLFADCKNSAYSGQMKLTQTLMLLLLLINSLTQAALYKSIDADGTVTYSDRPNLKTDKPLILPSENVIQSIPITTKKTTAKTPTETTNNYNTLNILTPANESTLRSNSGNISLGLQLEPTLQATHQLRILLDGNEAKLSRSLQVSLTNIPRGQHSLSVQIIDADNRVLKQSPSHTIYLQRHSKLF